MRAEVDEITQQADASVQGLLLDIDKFASHDGPGIRTTVFLKGCPLSCVWCHSPESRLSTPELLYQSERCNGCRLCIEICPQKALTLGHSGGRSGEGAVAVLDSGLCDTCGKCVEVCYPGALKLAGITVSVGDLVSQVEKDLPFFRSSGGGVTLSGGEPARQFEFSYNFLLGCRERGIHTALETTGYARWDVMSALASVTDLLLYDVKFIDADSHYRYTGVPNKLILDNLRKLAERNHEIHVRVPCIPGVNDGHHQVRATAQFVAEVGIERVVLLPYNGAAGAKYEWIGIDYELDGIETQSDEYMNQLADLCRQEGLSVQIGG